MPVNRFYTSDELKSGSNAVVRDAEHHHLAHVVRTKEGDEVELVNGRGFLAKGAVSSIGRHEASISINDAYCEDPPSNKVIIVQAIPKANRLEFILEKCTELGMDELWLFPGEKSEKKQVKESQIKRMETIVIGAMKQSGRLYLPKLLVKDHFSKWNEKPEGELYFGDVDPSAPSLLKALPKNIQFDQLFFIGPESGFTKSEEQTLREMGAQGVKLHKNILRTDTAPMVVLSVVGFQRLSPDNL